jgi:hypothetical protein
MKEKIAALMNSVKNFDDMINLCTKLCLTAIIAGRLYVFFR